MCIKVLQKISHKMHLRQFKVVWRFDITELK